MDYDYLGTFRVLVRVYPENGTRLTFLDGDGLNVVGYDGLRRPVELRHARTNDSLIVGFSASYDRMNNKIAERKLHDPANDESYRYDSAHRLTAFSRPHPSATAVLHQSWSLDGVGNWTEIDGQDRTHNSFNELVSDNAAAFEYDDNGNQTVNGDAGVNYQWDFRNRLRRATRQSDGLELGAYFYDAANRRVRTVVAAENSGPGAPSRSTNFYYDAWQVVEERSDDLIEQYVYGGDIDEPLIIDRTRLSAPNSGRQRHFYHQGMLHSVFALTDNAAEISEGYQYEMLDYSSLEGFGELLGFGSSLGPAQISMATAKRYGLTSHITLDKFTDQYVGEKHFLSAKEQYYHALRDYLISDAGSINAAAKLMRSYLDRMCACAGQASESFRSLTGGCKPNDFCFSSKDCSQVTDANVPSCVMSAMAMAWNNDIGIMQQKDIVGNTPNAYHHGTWAGRLEKYIDPTGTLRLPMAD